MTAAQQQIFNNVYLIIVLAILVCQVYISYRNSKNNQKILKVLVDVSAKNAASAEQSVKATQSAINLLNEVLHGHP